MLCSFVSDTIVSEVKCDDCLLKKVKTKMENTKLDLGLPYYLAKYQLDIWLHRVQFDCLRG
jgi:hypothetical protein